MGNHRSSLRHLPTYEKSAAGCANTPQHNPTKKGIIMALANYEKPENPDIRVSTESAHNRARRMMPRGVKMALIAMIDGTPPTSPAVLEWMRRHELIEDRMDGTGLRLTKFGYSTASSFKNGQVYR